MNQNMNPGHQVHQVHQEAEKIVNIEHADNVHIDMNNVSADVLNKLLNRFQNAIDCTMFMMPPRSQEDFSRDFDWSPFSSTDKLPDTYKPGDVVMSNWRIDKLLGRGSISSVYEAHHMGHGTRYKSAIKVVRSSIKFPAPLPDTTVIGTYEFQKELNNLVSLRGTGYIVDYEDHEEVTFRDDTHGFIIRMELLDSIDDKHLTEDDAVRLGIDICKALEFCHKLNIIHCDVKPSNIYATKWGGFKLGDFSASINDNNQENNRIGTLKYMAPEVFQGEPFTSNVDTYSLGLVLYEILDPNHFSRRKFLSNRLSGTPLPAIPGADERLQAIIVRACAYDPGERYSSPTEMLKELMKL